MKKSEYRQIISQQTKMIKDLENKNKALCEYCKRLGGNKRTRLKIIANLCDLSNKLGDECMIPESKVVQMCIEAVKKAYV